METTTKLPKAIIRKIIKQTKNKNLVSDIYLNQFGKDVLVTFDRANLVELTNALDVHGFGYDFCTLVGDYGIVLGDGGAMRGTLIVSIGQCDLTKVGA